MERMLFSYYSYCENLFVLLLELSPPFVRSIAFSLLFKSMGRGGNIDYGTYFRYLRKISIGDETWINRGVKIYASHKIPSAVVTIGSRVSIGPDVRIFSAGHDHTSIALTDIARSVTIGDDVWIGGGSLILPGVTIGDGAVVGAGSVVSRDVAPWSIVMGVPARFVKTRIVDGPTFKGLV